MTTEASAGATPAAAGATPAQTTPVSPAAAASPVAAPAKGADDPLGETGLRALQSERERAAAAERERDEWRGKAEKLATANQTESERAISTAKAEGAAEVTERFHGQIRRAEVRTALTSAGISPSVLDLAAKADEFAALKVNDEGEVTGLDAAVAKFKQERADLFGSKATPRPGDSGLGPRGTPAAGGPDLNSWIRAEARK